MSRSRYAHHRAECEEHEETGLYASMERPIYILKNKYFFG